MKENKKSSGREVAVSASRGLGLEDLLALIDGALGDERVKVTYAIPAPMGQAMAWLYAQGQVESQKQKDDLMTLCVRLSPADQARFEKRFHLKPQKTRASTGGGSRRLPRGRP